VHRRPACFLADGYRFTVSRPNRRKRPKRHYWPLTACAENSASTTPPSRCTTPTTRASATPRPATTSLSRASTAPGRSGRRPACRRCYAVLCCVCDYGGTIEQMFIQFVTSQNLDTAPTTMLRETWTPPIELCVKLPPLHSHLSYEEWSITHTSIPFRRCHSITVRIAVTDPEAAEQRVTGR
jgi:hypothetical protein